MRRKTMIQSPKEFCSSLLILWRGNQFFLEKYSKNEDMKGGIDYEKEDNDYKSKRLAKRPKKCSNKGLLESFSFEIHFLLKMQ